MEKNLMNKLKDYENFLNDSIEKVSKSYSESGGQNIPIKSSMVGAYMDAVDRLYELFPNLKDYKKK